MLSYMVKNAWLYCLFFVLKPYSFKIIKGLSANCSIRYIYNKRRNTSVGCNRAGMHACEQDGVWIKKANMKDVGAARPLCRFYLINPERNASVNSTVRKLIGISERRGGVCHRGPSRFHSQGHSHLCRHG